MQFNTNFKAKELQRLSLKNFLGVDYASSVFNVDSKRATDMRNFININGINRKRNGWNEFANFNDKINGYWEFKDKDNQIHKIIQSGINFYRLIDTEYVLIPFNGVSLDRLINDRSFGVVAGERLYLLCGDYLVYGNWGNDWEIRRVEDNEDTFIPTTTIGIVNINSAITDTRIGYDKINALSRKRKNKLIGEKKSVALDITKTADVYASQYAGYIQSVNSLEYENLIKTKITIINDESVYNISNFFELNSNLTTLTFDPNNSINDFGNMWYDGYNSGDLSSFFVYFKVTQKYENNKLYLVVSYYFKEGKEQTRVLVEGVQTLKYMLDTDNIDEDEEVKVYNYETLIDSANYTINYEEGSITFTNEYLPSIEGQSNITVEFSKYIEGYADRINKCRFGTLYGYNAGRDNLFVAGNPDYPNVDFYSSETYSVASNFDGQLKNYGDFTYFPIINYQAFGNEISEIMDYKVLNDGTQIIMKRSVGNEPTIYFRTSTTIPATDEYGNSITSITGYQYQEIVYPIQTGTIGEGCISRFGNATLNGDILMLSNNGVFGIQYGQNIKVDDKYAKERSRLIYDKLKELDLSKAVSIVYDNRYYLAVEDLVFIADSRFKSSLLGDSPDTFNYEWWVWDYCPVRVWFIQDNKLCFGTDDGMVCSFNNTYKDTYTEKTLEGAITLDFITNSFYYSPEHNPNIVNGTILEIKDTDDSPRIYELILSKDEIIKIENNKIFVTLEKLYDYIRYLEDKTVYVDNSSDDNLLPNGENKIINIDYTNYSFELLNGEITSEIRFNLATKLEGTSIVKLTEYGEFRLLSFNGVNERIFTMYNGSLAHNLIGLIHKERNVECLWVTPVFDFGTIDYSKNITSITVLTEIVKKGELIVGYKTRDNSYDFNVQGVSIFDFEDIDFNNFTFETSDFARSYTKDKKIKNFNFAQFYFKSINDRDCAVNEISVLFTLGRKNKGVK